MFDGELLAITIRPARKAAVEELEEAELVADQGLMGDHACSADSEAARQLTLIESEALQLAASDYELALTHAESRRNLLTRDVPLNHLVGQRFRIGDAVLEGLELCEPCKYLERCLGRAVVDPLRHRGGLRARVVEGGKICVADRIRPH